MTGAIGSGNIAKATDVDERAKTVAGAHQIAVRAGAVDGVANNEVVGDEWIGESDAGGGIVQERVSIENIAGIAGSHFDAFAFVVAIDQIVHNPIIVKDIHSVGTIVVEGTMEHRRVPNQNSK